MIYEGTLREFAVQKGQLQSFDLLPCWQASSERYNLF